MNVPLSAKRRNSPKMSIMSNNDSNRQTELIHAFDYNNTDNVTKKYNSEFKIDLSNTENSSRNKSMNNSRPDSKGRPRSSGRNREINKDNLEKKELNNEDIKLDLEIKSKVKEEGVKSETLFTN